MSVVDPDERPAAASITAVPRSLGSALSPMLGGALLAASTFGGPLVIAGALKGAYDLLLVLMFRKQGPRSSACDGDVLAGVLILKRGPTRRVPYPDKIGVPLGSRG